MTTPDYDRMGEVAAAHMMAFALRMLDTEPRKPGRRWCSIHSMAHGGNCPECVRQLDEEARNGE